MSLSSGSPLSSPTGSLPGGGGGRLAGTVVLLVLMAATAAYVIGFQNRMIKRMRAINPYQGITYTATDGQRLIPLSMGYRLSLADFLWMRSIQAFGGLSRNSKQYRSLFNLFFVITDLDPRFVEAYKFGSLVMGDEGGDQEKSLELLEKGMFANHDNYRPPYEAAYCLMYSMKRTEKNKKRALFFAQMALKRPDCPEWVRRFRDEILSGVGKHEFAMKHSLRGYLEAIDDNEAVIMGVYRRRLMAAVHEWQRDQLMQQALRFKQKHGRDATSLEEVLALDPQFRYRTLDIRKAMDIIDALAQQEQAKEKRQPLESYFEQILAYSSVETNQPPLDPRVWDDINRVNERVGYRVVRGSTSEDYDEFIQSDDDLMSALRQYLGNVRFYLKEYLTLNKKLPERFEEALPPGQMVRIEPYGGQWLYDPSLMPDPSQGFNNAVFRSSTHPEM